MPPLPIVPMCMLIRMIFTDGADTNIQNTFHYRYTGSVSGADQGTLATTIGANWTSHMAPLSVTIFSLESIAINDLNSPTGAQTQTAISSPGTSSGVAMPSATCFVVTSKTLFKYRGGHSRQYLGGMPNTALLNENTWTSTAMTNVPAAWHHVVFDSAATAPVAMGTCTPTVVHRFSSNPADFPGGHPSTPPPWPLATPVTHDILNMVGNPRVGSQRRRNQQP